MLIASEIRMSQADEFVTEHSPDQVMEQRILLKFKANESPGRAKDLSRELSWFAQRFEPFIDVEATADTIVKLDMDLNVLINAI